MQVNITPCLVVVFTVFVFCATGHSQIFSEDFDPRNGGSLGTQLNTSLPVSVNNTYLGWTTSGTSHAVDLDSSAGQNWAAMFWETHAIVSSSFAANSLGVIYTVNFDAGPGVWASNGQQTTSAERLIFQIRDASTTVIGSLTYDPSDWGVGTGPGVLPMTAGSFNYTGNGNGTVSLRIAGQNTGRFNGTVDNITVVPEPTTFALASIGLLSLLTTRRRSI